MLSISVIMTLGLMLTPLISNVLRLHRKRRGLVALILIIFLNIGNSLVFGNGDWRLAMAMGVQQGLMAVGLYSSVKNALEKS